MADTKISDLPAATVVNPSDIFPIVQSGTTKQAAVDLLPGGNASLVLHSSGDGTTRQNSGTLIVGQDYLIYIYSNGDDFTNVGANSNASGVSFTATGTTPSVWSNSSVLYAQPYTYQNSGIIVTDANDVEIWRLWADDPTNQIDNLFLGRMVGSELTIFGTDNLVLGIDALTGGVNTLGNGNTIIGHDAARTSDPVGDQNTIIGESALFYDNGVEKSVAIGNSAAVVSNAVAIGFGANAIAPNAIAIGSSVTADDDNLVALGNSDNKAFVFGGSNVGINDVLTLTPIADPPSNPAEGMIYADTDHHLYYYNGSTWKQLDN